MKVIQRRLWGQFMALAAACLLMAGCGSKRVTKANFDKITDGMPRADVEMILGKGEEPAETDLATGSSVAGAAGIGGDLASVSRPASGVKIVKWGDDKKWIKIGFRGDRVEPGTKQQQGL